MPAPLADKLVRLRDNFANLLLLTQQAMATHDRAAVDAVFAAADTAGVMRPKVSHSADGESYSWTEYARFCLDAIDRLDALIQRASGPYQVKSRGRS